MVATLLAMEEVTVQIRLGALKGRQDALKIVQTVQRLYIPVVV